MTVTDSERSQIYNSTLQYIQNKQWFRLLFILVVLIFKPSNQNDTKIKTVHKLFKENTCFFPFDIQKEWQQGINLNNFLIRNNCYSVVLKWQILFVSVVLTTLTKSHTTKHFKVRQANGMGMTLVCTNQSCNLWLSSCRPPNENSFHDIL